MLRELHISNLAVIEDIAIELAGGLNCFTGQTGAGKSLILGALEILLGLKPAAAEMIRPGAAEARISGLFTVHDDWITQQIAQLADTAIDPGDDLLLTRKLFASGRNSASLNGQPVTGAMVKSIAELLVDVHGQHDHQFLLRPSNQLWLLDGYAGTLEDREHFAELHQQRRTLTTQRNELLASTDLRRQQLDLYEFQAGEIDKAEPNAGEYNQLRERHAFLSNVQKIKREAGGAYAALYESEGAVLERLQMIAHVLSETALLDPRMNSIAEQVRTATLGLQEGAYELQRYVDRLELDPGELTQVEDRLNTLNRLIAKYGQQKNMATSSAGSASVSQVNTQSGSVGQPDPLAPVLAYREQLETQLQQLRHHDSDISQLEAKLAQLEKDLTTLAGKLSKARKAAAQSLRPLVEKQLQDLGMGEAQFDVELLTVEPSASGTDAIEMLVRANPGLPARPLRKVASGGELSRIMLALKTILAQSDRISVLVFDEIDANIGGRMGTIIGTKLRTLAQPLNHKGTSPRTHQVICITHLPQIAAFAQKHFRIFKEVSGKGSGKETRTVVTALEGKARIEELAEMLAGKDVTSTTRKQVSEMLTAAENT